MGEKIERTFSDENVFRVIHDSVFRATAEGNSGGFQGSG